MLRTTLDMNEKPPDKKQYMQSWREEKEVPSAQTHVSNTNGPTKRKQVKATYLNYITVGWLTSTMFAGAKKTIESDDLMELQDKDKSFHLSHLMDPFWADFNAMQTDKSIPIPSLFKIFRNQFSIIFIVAVFLQGCSVACLLTMPTFLQQIIFYLNPMYPKSLLKLNSGEGLCFILCGLQAFSSIFRQTSLQMFNSLQINIKTILIGAIYEKSLRLSQTASVVFNLSKKYRNSHKAKF